MAGLRALSLALLLTVGTIGGISVVATQTGPSMTVHTVENTSNYFGPNASDVERSGQASTSLDVAATVSAKAGEVRTTYTSVSLRRHRYERAETDQERRAVVGNGTDQLTQRVDALERKEVSAIDRYARGEIDETDLFRTLASIDAEARELDGTVEWLRNRATDNGMTEEARRISTLRIRLVALRGPARDDIRRGLDGTAPTRVYAETASGGLVLATVTGPVTGDGQAGEGPPVYVREAYTPAIRDRADSGRYGTRFGPVFDRLREIYPWVGSEFSRVDNSAAFGSGGARLWTVTFQHGHGSLRPFLDGGTDRIVKEHQRLQVDRMPTDRRNATSDDSDLLVTVETTYDTGPMAVTAVDNETGVAVDATVLVDGERVGTTDRERLWFVDPRGRTNVTVAQENRSVTVAVTSP